MKAEARILDYESNVTGERVAMSLDPAATAHLMSVLTDLYSDPELAVVREYSTNALDAHKVARVKRPIEVQLPTPLAPFFKVRDYGEGLDADDIRDVFSRYGTSTKRESNDVVGMLGLGCKSALTYADQFTLTSTKDGRTIQVLISRDEDGAGSMSIVAEHDAGNAEQGTEIVVPAKRHNTFEMKAREFFQFWTRGDVSVNGEHPERIDGLWLSPRLLLTKSVDQAYVVMGNVAYPIPSDAPTFKASCSSYGQGSYYAVAFVDIGEVSFTPSREALQMTKGTREALANIAADFEAKRDESVRRQVADAKSPAEAVRLAAEGRAVGFQGEATYQGRKVPENLDRTPRDASGKPIHSVSSYDGTANDPAKTFLHAGGRYQKVKGERGFTAEIDADQYWFTGFDGRELTPTKRDKLTHWLETHKRDVKGQVYVVALSDRERFWLDGATIYDWSDIDAVKLPRDTAPDGTPKLRGTYSALVGGREVQLDAADIDTSRPIYYLHGNMYQLRADDAIRYSVLDWSDGTFIALPGGRIDKFRRDFPSAMALDAAARKAAERWKAGLDPKDVRAWTFQTRQASIAGRLKGLDPARVNDPELRKAIVLASRDVSNLKSSASKFGRWTTAEGIDQVSDPLGRYPLLGNGYGVLASLGDHCYLYVNAAYAADGKDGK